MSDKLGFSERKAQLNNLLDQRYNLKLAVKAAELLVRDYPRTAEAYYLLNLVVSLCNDGGASLQSGQGLRDMAEEHCPDFTPLIKGDMMRDRALGLIRFRKNAGHLNTASLLLKEAGELHRNDPNRMACLLGFEGRLAFARGKHGLAVRMHEEADRQWRSLGDEADQLWIYLNLVQWLRAEVALNGRSSRKAQYVLFPRIRDEVPSGQGSRTKEGRILLLPGGLRVYRIAEQRRG